MRAITVGILLAVVMDSPRAAATAEAAPNVIAALRAASGCVAWGRLGTLEIAGTHVGGGLNGPFQDTIDTRKGRYLETWRSGGFTLGDGFDGMRSWERDFSGTIHIKDAPSALAKAKTEAWLRAHGWCNPRSARYTYVETGPSADGGKLDVVAARPVGGATVNLYLNRRSHLIDRTSLRYDEYTEITQYADWRTVTSAAVPFKIDSIDPEDQETSTKTVSNVTPVSGVATVFAPPKTAFDVTLPANATAVTVPYVFDGIKPIVNVTINGKGPFPLVIDTGGHFILTAQTAERLGLTGLGRASSANEHAIHHVGFVHVARLAIGGAVLHNAVAEINPYAYAKLERGPRPPKAGWIGLELFERFAVTFDPSNRLLTLRPLTKPRPTPAGTKLPLVFDEDSPLTTCSIDRLPGICMLDTGNAGETIVANEWAQRKGLNMRLSGGIDVGGEHISRARISFGPFVRRGALVKYASGADAELFNVEAAVISEALIDGFVTTFDYARRGMWLQPARRYTPAPFTRSGVVVVKRADGAFAVRYILRHSPAYSADIQSGDLILSIDGKPSAQFSTWDFSSVNASRRANITYGIRRGNEHLCVTIALRDLLPPSDEDTEF